MLQYEIEAKREEEHPKDPIYRHGGVGMLYAIFRIGKKFTNIGMIGAFQKHMQREIAIENANQYTKENNEILIGTGNIKEDVEKYIEGIKLRKNGVVARELLLTASPNFFQGLTAGNLEKWKQLNTDWLRANFGDNCVYAVLHKDESTWHIHALVVPKFYDEKRQRFTLANCRYFDGIEKLRGWQDNYSECMKSVFKALNRGIKFSKAKHIEVRHFYNMVNAKLNDQDIRQVCAKAKNSELLEIKIKALQNTLAAYKNINNRSLQEIESMRESLKGVKDDERLYKTVVESLSESYKIPQYAVKNVINNVQKGVEGKSMERVK
jgi:hypothetical protein